MKQFLNKVLGSTIKDTVGSIGTAVDSLSTSDEEKLKLKNELTSIVNTSLNFVIKAQADIINAEASGNWLQRSWRPILMLSFGFIIIYTKFVAPAFSLPNTELESDFWELLRLGVGGYVVGRSVEKVADKVTKNVDMPFLKKKDRAKD